MSAAFRCHVYLVFAAVDQRDADMIWESVEAAAEKLGCIVEGGSVQRIHPNGIIPDSPLAHALAAASASATGEDAG